MGNYCYLLCVSIFNGGLQFVQIGITGLYKKANQF